MRLALMSMLALCAWFGANAWSEKKRLAPKKLELSVGFADADITPVVGKRPVYLAGFGQNRRATGVHDPLKARAVVLSDGTTKIGIVSVDLIGLFHESVLRVRRQLKGFDYVVVSSTHNHEGPDTMGLWGPNPFTSGVSPAYLKSVEDAMVAALTAADAKLVSVRAGIGIVAIPELLHDGREPYIKHDELVALRFRDAEDRDVGVIVQWNCHPETLDSGNTEISADFVGYTVAALEREYRCPALYITGTVGGLMTSLHVEIKNDKGEQLRDGTFEKTERFGKLVAEAGVKALKDAKAVQLTPIEARSREVYIPLENKLYLMARQLGVLDREAYVWEGDERKAKQEQKGAFLKPLCLRTEIGWIRLGELEAACIPGEIYPELVLDKVQEPADPGADFPKAEREPGIYKQMKGPWKMMIGLANDEIGYIIPKRQWDQKPPHCYGRKQPQYGEINSVGPETAPILCKAFKELVEEKR